jgi:hypothetical protein
MKDYFEDILPIYSEQTRLIKRLLYERISGVSFTAPEDHLDNNTAITKDIESKILKFFQSSNLHITDFSDNAKALLSTLYNNVVLIAINNESPYSYKNLSNSEYKFTDYDVSFMRQRANPFSINCVKTIGNPTILIYSLQKVLTRLAGAEITMTTKEDMAVEDNGFSSNIDDMIKNKGRVSNFRYKKDKSIITFSLGNEIDINDITKVIMENKNVNPDCFFVTAVDDSYDNILAFGKFNEFIMMPVITHIYSSLSQISSNILNQILNTTT